MKKDDKSKKSTSGQAKFEKKAHRILLLSFGRVTTMPSGGARKGAVV